MSETRNKQIMIRLSEVEKKKLEALAKANDRKVADYCRLKLLKDEK
jgi:predicted DNA-binding protein